MLTFVRGWWRADDVDRVLVPGVDDHFAGEVVDREPAAALRRDRFVGLRADCRGGARRGRRLSAVTSSRSSAIEHRPSMNIGQPLVHQRGGAAEQGELALPRVGEVVVQSRRWPDRRPARGAIGRWPCRSRRGSPRGSSPCRDRAGRARLRAPARDRRSLRRSADPTAPWRPRAARCDRSRRPAAPTSRGPPCCSTHTPPPETTISAMPAAASWGSVNEKRRAGRAWKGSTPARTAARGAMPGHRSFAGGRGVSDAACATTSRSSASVAVHSPHEARCASSAARSAGGQLVVQVFRQAVGPGVSHFRCFRSIIRARCSCAFDVPAEISSSVAISWCL